MESEMSSTSRAKMTFIPSFVRTWSAHGSPSISFHSTLHIISSDCSLWWARNDKRSICAQSSLKSSSSDLEAFQNCL